MSLSPSVLNFFLPSESPLPPAPPELTVQAPTPSTSTSDANLNPVSYTELATLSKVSQEWSDCVLSAFVLPTTSSPHGSPTYRLNPKLTKCLCWFDERGIEARSVSVRRGGKRGGKDLITLCTGWRGWDGVDEVMEIMGFDERFRNRVREKLGEGEDGMVVGSKRAHVMSKADQPQVLLNTNAVPSLPCVQFLNWDSSSAVRMRTSEFLCGPVPQPVTVFVVGIASEDGCFVSGLRGRFEIGHMYPDDRLSEQMDMSPVVMSASFRPSSVHRNVSSSINGLRFTSSSNSDSEDSSSASSSTGESELSVASNPPEEHMVKGKSRPGRWHVYTCVFDGESSTLRVDGQVEGTGGDGVSVGEGMLGGMTIGSDHFFNMSLCDGGAGMQLDNGEGRGAIAEVGAFKGRLGEGDIKTIEERLMKKHGISPGTASSLSADTHAFHAHSLIAQPLPWSLSRRVPLKFAAQEKSVVWKRNDPVTGEKVVISRIGTNKTGSDSEW
ncbi:hypothetical protein TrCOL_g12351 [Triparma columacea]|uniref:Uncharacterized protein n=1 Tax=Triparma columacea TaxID=722753 RepID=A0A9W7GMX4_9STRA|nr:hypothetical protein TrCOL_g12351 [Triparma columacea]